MRSKFITIFILLLALIACSGYSAYAYSKSLPALTPQVSFVSPKAGKGISMPWPAYGEAAIGAMGAGVIETHGTQKPLPTASIAKVMTALAVLKQKPLAVGEQGPVITITQTDINSYDNYFSKGGSLVKVAKGEKITEYQALQAMLLPSANNMADTLARWAFGSISAYNHYANNYAKQLGLTHTVFATDASGFGPQTQSTAHDLILLGQAALDSPILAQIVAQKYATVPVAHKISNVNFLLGQHDIIGIKTGNNDQDKGVYLVAAKHSITPTKSVVVLAVIMGAPSLWQAMHDAIPLIQSAKQNFQLQTVIKPGDVVGEYRSSWGETTQAVAAHGLTLLTWKGQKVEYSVNLSKLKPPLRHGQSAGNIVFTDKLSGGTRKIPLVLTSSISEPTWQWRLRHPLR